MLPRKLPLGRNKKLWPVFIVGVVALFSRSGVAAQIIAYTGTGATPGGATGNLNIGHQFSVTGTGVTIHDVGVWDNGGDGLVNSHVVTLFQINSGAGAAGANVTAITGGSATVPSGTVATLNSGFRMMPLASPIFLAPGNYAEVAYGTNVSGGDSYGDGGVFPAGGNVTDIRFDPYEFSGNVSPTYPANGDANIHASATFDYDLGNTVPEPATLGVVGLGLLPIVMRRRCHAVGARQSAC